MAFDGPIGPATKDNSLPVTIATDQPAIDVSISSSSLPTGAATEAKQDVGNTSLSSIDGKVPSGLTVTSTRLLTDGSGVTQPISAASLPLPSGASTSALQTQPGVDIGDVTINNTGGVSAVNIQDGGNSITVDGTVAISGSVAVTGPLTDIQLRASAVPISAASLPLPSGAATSALQTQPGVDIGDVTINNASGVSAVNIQDGGNSITVDGSLTSVTTVSTITNVVHVDDNGGSLTVDGSVTANAGTNLNTSALNLETTQSAMSAKLPASLGTKTIANSLAVNIASDQTIPISEIYGVISTANSSTTPLGIAGTFTGTAEEVTQYLGIAVAIGTDRNGTLNIDYSIDNSNWDQTQVYPLTVASPGSVSGFFFQFMSEARYYRLRYVNGGTAQGVFRLQSILKTNAGVGEVQYIQQPIIASTDALVTKGVIYGVTTGGGGGYVAVKVTPSGSLTTAIGDITGIVGQNTMANSIPVTIASNQTAVPISAASLPLPTLAATSTIQTDGTQKSIVRGGAKGATTAADVTSTSQSVDRNALDVQIRTSTGVVVDTFGGGTQYTEDVAAAADPTGNMGMAVRADTLAAVTSTDGDNIALRSTNKGELYVKQTDVVPVTDNGGSITVDGTFFQATQPISVVTLPLPTGAATSAAQTDKSQFTKITDGTDTALVTATGELNVLASAQPGVDIGDITINNAAGASAVNIQDGGNSITVDGTVASTQSGTWTVQPGNTANTTAWLNKELRPATSSVTSVASSATNVTLLASNVNRIQATFYNDSTKILYLKFGATATSSSFTVQMASGSFFELPFPCYTGIIDGIWSSANGNCRITEVTA